MKREPSKSIEDSIRRLLLSLDDALDLFHHGSLDSHPIFPCRREPVSFKLYSADKAHKLLQSKLAGQMAGILNHQPGCPIDSLLDLDHIVDLFEKDQIKQRSVKIASCQSCSGIGSKGEFPYVYLELFWKIAKAWKARQIHGLDVMLRYSYGELTGLGGGVIVGVIGYEVDELSHVEI